MKIFFPFLIIFVFSCANLIAQNNKVSFIRGADLSSVPRIEDHNGIFKLNGNSEDVLDIFKQSGANYIRLRLWHSPSDGYCGLAKTIAFAKRIKAKGFKFLLDIHYSDTWADPGHQTKPAAWANLSFNVLKDSVYSYTKDVITALKNRNALPDMVQIGNEVTGGMLWPDGKNNTANGWANFAALLKAGIKGVKDAAITARVKIMIHIDRGGYKNITQWFFDNIKAYGVDYDVIGLSYYPWWSGTFSQLKINLNALADRYGKDIVIAETAYPWTNKYVNDGVSNVGYDPSKLPAGYPVNEQGQRDFILYLKKLIKNTKNHKGIGYFYWEPAYISVPGAGSGWENYTTFDFKGNSLPSIQTFQDIDSVKTVNVTLRFNTSTMGDTLNNDDIVQIRGEVKGIGAGFFPSGERISWGTDSQLILKNIDGDYWEYTVKMYPFDQLRFLLWTGFNLNKPTQPDSGSETPVISYDSSSGNYRLFTAGITDTVLDWQYYNSTLNKREQYWSPFAHYKDSVGILFRVNISHLIETGLFDTSKNNFISVRGDSAATKGILSWNSDNVKLNKENISGGNNSFWSKVVYFPNSKISIGSKIKYKFFVGNSSFGGWESGIRDREFSFPNSDTTLVWKFFNNKKNLTSVLPDKSIHNYNFKLFQNYPNPFNPSTKIKFFLPKTENVTIKIYDMLGKVVATLLNKQIDAGYHIVYWNGKDRDGNSAASGIYVYRLTTAASSVSANSIMQTKKMLLLK